MSETAEFEERYRRAFIAYVKDQGGEARHLAAHELGKAAMEEGRSVLDMLSLHHSIMPSFLSRARKGRGFGELVAKSEAFLAEVAAPFETIHRAWHDIVVQLRQANEVLELQLAQRSAALHESEQRFRDIAEVSEDWIWETDTRHRFKSVIGESMRPTGYAAKEIVARTRWALAGGDSERDEHWRRHKADLDAHRPFHAFHYSMTDKEDRPLHLSISGKPVFDAEGGFRGYRGTATNETHIVEALRRAEAAEALLRDAVETISEGFVIFDRDDRFVMCNEAYRRMFSPVAHLLKAGTPYEAIARHSIETRLYADAADREEEWLAERLSQHRDATAAVERSLADGRTILLTDRRMANGGNAGLRIDITALKRAEAARRESEEQLRGIAENLPGAIFRRLLKPDGTASYAYVSDGLRDLYGVEPSRLVSGEIHLRDLMPPADRLVYEEATRRSIAGLTPLELEFRIETKKAGMRWIRSVSKPRRRDDGTIIWDGVALDITELKKLEADRDYLAYYDQLTRLPNRALFVDRLARTLEGAEGSGTSAVVIAAALVSLRDIRDGASFAAGDAAIGETARRLAAVVQGRGTVAHVGEGDFFVLLTDVAENADHAAILGEIARRCESSLRLEGREFRLKLSMGVSVAPADGERADTLIRNATTALHEARALPGRPVRFYSAQMTEHAAARLVVEAELRRAIERQELVLFYQPLVDARTLRITGCEALMRWRHPERGLIPPGKFIPVAEESGLIVPLGEFALRSACAQARDWERMGLAAIPVSVNLSGWQLLADGLAERILAVLEEVGLAPALLKLELTESTILHNVDAARRTMERLAEAGVRFAIDDFGIEHSALSHLSRLPIETLKIDYSFVSQMTHDTAHAALVQAIISMTHAMGKLAVAEGVETKVQLTYLQAYQCDTLQGFLFSRAVPPERFLPLLQRHILDPVEEAET